MQLTIRKLITTACLFLVTTFSFSQNLKEIKLQLKWYHQFQFAGYYAASIKGYYKNEGLNVKILEGSTDISPIEVISKNKAEFGIFDPEILIKNPKDNPLMAVFAVLQSSPYAVLSKPESNIRRPSDLIGKKVLAAGDQGWNIFKAILLKEGLPVDSTSIIPRTQASEEILNGKGDAVITYYTSQVEKLRALGFNPTILRPVDYGIDFYGDVIFTTRSYAEKNPETVAAFNRATRKGWEYALKHKDEMISYIMKLPGVNKSLTKTVLKYEANELEKLIVPDFVEIGHMNPGRWQNMLSIYQELGLVKKDVSLKNFLFEEHQTKVNKWFEYVLYGLCVAAGLLLIIFIWNRQLRKMVNNKTAELQKENNIRRKAEQRLQLVIDSAGIGLWDWDIDKSKDITSGKWIQRFGYNVNDDSPDLKNWDMFIHPEDIEGVISAKEEVHEGEIDYNSSTYRIATPAGEWRWIITYRRAMAWDDKGKATHITGMHLDISDIKGKEEELQELTKELTKINVELEKFAYITSHNLRAPVVNLKSLIDLYETHNIEPELKEDLYHKIKQSIHRLDQTLNDLVEIVSRKSSHKEEKVAINLQDEFDQVLFSIETQVHQARATVKTDFADAETIQFSKKHLHSIFLNLLTNALKYRAPERPLEISISSKKINEFIIVKFADNGTGIDLQKFRNKIFGLYQRFHNKVEGKGLGLYIIKSQIEAMDGKIDVEETLGGGLTFKVWFHDPD